MANHTVNPGDKIQKVLNRADAGDTIEFQKGTYKNLQIEINTKNLTLRGEKAKMTGNTSIKLSRSGVTVEGFTFVGNSVIDAAVNKVKDEDTMGKNAVIRNNTFKNFTGYAKRIKVASSSAHEAINMNPLIEDNTFINIKGSNNKGKPGGELISVKASGAKIRNNKFSKVAGMISLRGGEHSVAEGNVMMDAAPKISGIQVYGSHNQIIDNQLDDGTVIILGSGEANTGPGKQPFGDHLPANDALVEGNKGGTIILNYNFGGTGKKRSRKQDIQKYGERRVYKYKTSGVKLENNSSKVVDRAKKKKKSR